MQKVTRLLIVLAAALLGVAFLAVLVRVGMSVRHTLLLFALGGLVAYAMDPLVEGLGKIRLGRAGKEIPREGRVLAVLGALILAAGLGVWALAGQAGRQAANLRRELPQYRERTAALAGWLDARLAAAGIRLRAEEALRRPPPDIREAGARLGREVAPALGHAARDVGESALVLLIALYLLLYGPELRQKFNAALPDPLRRHADLWETDADCILGGFVRGQVLVALLMGAAAAVGCLAIGIRPWLLCGIVMAAASLIPLFGPLLGALPAVLAALVGPTHLHNPALSTAAVVVLFTVINEVGSKVLYPRLVGGALGLHTVVVLFVLLAGLELGGIVGVLFAAPLTALAVVTAVHLYRFWRELPDDLLVGRRGESEAAQPAKRPGLRHVTFRRQRRAGQG